LNPKWKIATALRSSAGPRGWLWRQRLHKLAAIYGITDEQGGISAILGTRWGYHHRETISRICLTEYPTGIHAQADGHDFWDHPEAPAPGDMIDVQITDSNGIRDGYLSAAQTAWQCAEKAARWNGGARRFVERFCHSARPITYEAKVEAIPFLAPFSTRVISPQMPGKVPGIDWTFVGICLISPGKPLSNLVRRRGRDEQAGAIRGNDGRFRIGQTGRRVPCGGPA
jgi:hypothetical protein